jgi:hypothetical protein
VDGCFRFELWKRVKKLHLPPRWLGCLPIGSERAFPEGENKIGSIATE